MFYFIYSFLVAGVAIIMVSLGGYLVTSPKDMLFVRYQNFRLNVTGRPLKDEDFPRADRMLTTFKISGFFLLLAGLSLLGFAFMGR